MVKFFCNFFKAFLVSIVYSYEGFIMFFLGKIYLTPQGRDIIISILEARCNVSEANGKSEGCECDCAKCRPQMLKSDDHSVIH